MTKRRVFVFFLILTFFIATFFILFFNLSEAKRPSQVYNISMIVRGKGSDSWTSMRQGAEQAAGEMNVDLSFITLSQENACNEQISLLWRELEGGSNTIILAAADYELVGKAVDRVAEKNFVVCVESPVNSRAVTAYVSADNYDMGVQIGNRIAYDRIADGLRVLILQSSTGCENIRLRNAGVREALENAGSVEITEASVTKVLTEEAWLSKLSEIDVLVALEPSALEAAAQFLSDNRASGAQLYGIGNSGRIASFLELGVITASVVQNDFGCGYLAVMCAVDALQNREVSTEASVEYRIIDSSNMYDPENQRLLFPFVR